MSLKSSIGVFEDTWYKQNGGVPTGGTLCVQLANIAVYSIMRKALYNKPELMEKVVAIKRYIDDGAGLFLGTAKDFSIWLAALNRNLSVFGLHIDESSIEPPGSFVPFLDIQYCFDGNGNLQTDLFTKPTDSKAYLHFSSAHPNHTFSGIVFSQFQRLRRIINDEQRLMIRINEFKDRFRCATYPANMVNNIAEKVCSTSRNLDYRNKVAESSKNDSTKIIRLVSTFGSDDDIVRTVGKFEEVLTRTRSFSTSDAPHMSHEPMSSTNTRHISKTEPTDILTPAVHHMITRTRSHSCSLPLPVGSDPDPPKLLDRPGIARTGLAKFTSLNATRKKIVQLVKRTGASVLNRVVKVKHLATGPRFGKTKPCHTRNCKCCKMCSPKPFHRYNNNKVKTAASSCSTYNIVYLVICSVCGKHYVGRSTRCLNTRMGEHRRHYYSILNNKPIFAEGDDQALGAHLYNHGYRDRNDFDNVYSVCVIDKCSPKALEVSEHKYIHRLNSLSPNGINLSNPFSVPLLYR